MEKIYEGIGLMSGTSLDGLDIAHCRFIKSDVWRFELLHAETIPYLSQWKDQLSEATSYSGEKLMTLDVELGSWMGNNLKTFIRANNLHPQFIASHGHTIFHQPAQNFTLQIGNSNLLHISTGLPIVYDFRSLDVAFGGQGAPLVPVGDHYLFSEYDACLNLGGIANISTVQQNQRIAYDIAPANMPINYLANQLDKAFDENGDIAASGKVNEHLFNQLNQLDYYKKKGSKSLGIEWVSSNIYPLLANSKAEFPDLLATISKHIGFQIGRAIPEGKVLVTGGGVYNKHLMEQIKRNAPHKTEFIIPKKEIIDFKEALIFSFLGLLRLRNEINCFKSVTGASGDSCSGSIIGDFNL